MSRHRLPGTTYLLPSVTLPPWLPSKQHLKEISSTPLTSRATDCHPWAPPIHFSVAYGANYRNLCWLIDWSEPSDHKFNSCPKWDQRRRNNRVVLAPMAFLSSKTLSELVCNVALLSSVQMMFWNKMMMRLGEEKKKKKEERNRMKI